MWGGQPPQSKEIIMRKRFSIMNGVAGTGMVLAVIALILLAIFIIPLGLLAVWHWAVMPIHPIIPAISFWQMFGICIGTMLWGQLLSVNVKVTKE
jgi:hypothetical protein